ncbi:hypothetical protein T492DRAFT_863962 [Pavlovales sp. CCMP2436]|nr:hypothetical protein T492DRAFT_863962 [Pavlovales sp. CCMP2436]
MLKLVLVLAICAQANGQQPLGTRPAPAHFTSLPARGNFPSLLAHYPKQTTYSAFLAVTEAFWPWQKASGHAVTPLPLSTPISQMLSLFTVNAVFVVGMYELLFRQTISKLVYSLRQLGDDMNIVENAITTLRHSEKHVHARELILRLYASQLRAPVGASVDWIAHLTEGFSSAQLRALVNQAAMSALLRGGANEKVTDADFRAALTTDIKK